MLVAEKANQVDGQEWFLTVTRNMSFWHQCLCNEGMFHHHKDFGVNAELRLLTLTVDSTKTSAFVYKDNNDKFVAAIIEATDSLEKIEKLRGKYLEFTDELFGALEKCRQSLNEKTFTDFINTYRRYTGGLMITTSYGRIGHEQLINRLKEIGKSEGEIPKIVSVATYPNEKTPFFNSQIDLLKMGIDVQEKGLNGKDLSDRLDSWLEKHKHVPVNFCEEPYTKFDLEAQLENVLKIKCSEKLELLENQHNESILNAKELLKGINDPEVTRLGQTLAKMTSINEFRKGVFRKVSLEYRPIFQEIVQRLGSNNWRDGFYMTYLEMMSVVNGEDVNLKDLIEKRKNAAMYTDKSGTLRFLPREKADNLFQLVYNNAVILSEEKATTIKGFSASKGKVTGTVKVVLSSKDFPKLLKGDILVTTMTSVDFVPVMERAAAFVTNEGGITSHASIVAREMGKPCIIGTKNATQVLKDGDVVEVDANVGIVKILK